MRFDPVLRALRGDAAPQRQAQHALIAVRDEWLADPCAAEVLRALGAYGSGAALADCAPLAAAMRTLRGARAFADGLLDRVVPALRAAPLGIAPFRHVSHRGVSSLLLARAGRAMLMLSAREPACPVPASIAFADGEQHEIVLAGAAQAHLVTLRAVDQGNADLARRTLALRAGSRIALDQAREALVVGRVERRLVVLRLIRGAVRPRPGREFALADGAFRRQASGDIDESRREMMFALLGRMERRDAAPTLAAIARDGAASPHLRWQALRESLALDTAAGFAALGAIARDVTDPLGEQAGVLRAQLVEAHPALGVLENA
ncbi:MAG TPA: hypothetical protein VF418_08715 [Sphingomonadaceae bacterium]